jgi:hypothetical protein
MTIPGGFVAGDVLTAANMNLLPGGVEGGGYSQATSTQSGITSITDLTNLTVTFTAVAGRRYKATVYVHIAQGTAVDGSYQVILREGVTELTSLFSKNPTVNESAGHCFAYVSNSSISGSKTWKVSLQRDSGTASLSLAASATRPAYLLIEDIGEL